MTSHTQYVLCIRPAAGALLKGMKAKQMLADCLRMAGCSGTPLIWILLHNAEGFPAAS